jgi:hypothetical protein
MAAFSVFMTEASFEEELRNRTAAQSFGGFRLVHYSGHNVGILAELKWPIKNSGGSRNSQLPG